LGLTVRHMEFSFLESVGFSRMEKAGEYGNRLSRTSATWAERP
jgi:hypothetical protein